VRELQSDESGRVNVKAAAVVVFLFVRVLALWRG